MITKQNRVEADLNTVNLLWTAGWDSTFRLLQLIIESDAIIQPIYLVDELRESAPREIDRMRRIRKQLEIDYPECRERILPTQYGTFRGTVIESHHAGAYEKLRERGRVGIQYPLLASYAEQNGLNGLELGIHRHEEGEYSIAAGLLPLCEVKETAGGKVYRLPEDVGMPEAMYSSFSFPLINLSKRDMEKKVMEWKHQSIMSLVWSCFTPVLGMPCGHCQPCKVAKKEGHGNRVGIIGPLIYSSQSTLNRIRTKALTVLRTR